MGANNSIQHAGVQYIIDSVLLSLQRNPDRKFIYVEQAFFQRWVEQASEQDYNEMVSLVQNGQLEFINAGWCMHDEAAPTYVDMISQTTLGHRLIKEQFGAIPLTTWQIDPFGHSATQQSLMTAASGFISLFFGRADYQDRALRDNTTNLEFIWRASASQPNLASFTGLIPGYGPPANMCFDINCSPIPVQDDPYLEDYNVDYMVDVVVSDALSMATNYKADSDGTIHLMWTLGSDFQYENANEWYKNLDKLIHYVNLNGTVNIFYSTPSIYTKAKLSQDITWSVTTADFFPYADSNHSMWSGYFTSRPGVKGYVRETSNYLSLSQQLQAWTGGVTDLGVNNSLYLLERAMGVAQHHDAVSGTEKQHVAFDYARRIARGRLSADAGNSAAFATLTGYKGGNFVGCDLANSTICPALESGTSNVIIIYNSQGVTKTGYEHIRIPVGLPNGVNSYTVTDSNGQPVTAQILPVYSADTYLRTTYYGYNTNTVAWLTFNANVPAAGFSTYFITPSATVTEVPSTRVSKERVMKTGTTLRGNVNDQTLTNGVITLTISGTTGMLSSYTNSRTGITTPFVQEWLWYNASIAGDASSNQPSGAYIFRPNSSTPFPVSTNPATVTLVTGPVVSEARIIISSWVTQIVRLWSNSTHIEIEYTVGPIPMNDNLGKEVITRYSTGWATNKTWITDSNGRDGIVRIRDYRPTWDYYVNEPVAGNYYPCNVWISTADTATGNRLGVITDRTQGCSSMQDGSVELMVHRRLTADDRRGVGEPLSEPGLSWGGNGLIIRGVHRITVDPAADFPASLKRGAQDLLFKSWLQYAPLNSLTPGQYISNYKVNYTGLTAPLPANVHLLTVQPQAPNTVLVRLAHLFETNEDPNLSKNATVDLATLFTSFTVTSVVETTLTANQPISEQPTYTLQIENEGRVTFPLLSEPPKGEAITVILAPMQIRTFICTTA